MLQKDILISAVISGLNILGGIVMSPNAALAIQIGLTVFAISVCLIFVFHFSKMYRKKSESDNARFEVLVNTQPLLQKTPVSKKKKQSWDKVAKSILDTHHHA